MANKTDPKYKLALADIESVAKAPAAAPPELATFEEVVDFAIREETKAYVSYMAFASQAKHPWTRKAFEGFAAEEVAHIGRLVEMKKAGHAYYKAEDVPDLKTGEYLTAELSPSEDMDTREAYVLAIRAEEAAVNLYRELAAKAEVPEVQRLLLNLAQEEAKHKLKLEMEYDDHFQGQN
jgi:rubrerythrin